MAREVLADLFEASARQHPQKIALFTDTRTLTYRELDTLADQAAATLITRGVRPGHIVGLWLPRGIELLVMQLAVAKTGAAWLPFDADAPVDRIAVCLQDACAMALLTSAQWAARLAALSCPVWSDQMLLAEAPTPLKRRADVTPEHPAYVIYTSGSTGKPKGIQISQGSICHFLRSENAVLGVREDDRVYQGFSAAFDMSFEEIWISYLVGATLWLAPPDVAIDPQALPQALIDHGITVLHAVPTLLALFGQDVPSLRLINLGGEMCPQALVARWARPGRQVFNTYGPTEATVSASLAELHPKQTVSIGTPLPNYGLLVIDTDTSQGLRLLPLGEAGELCICGPGVAAGYLGRPELTAEKFVTNPWAQAAHEARLYRTGDLARIDADGKVQCLGRLDDQVKIRGFRVELGEIEAALAQLPGVGTVAVLLRSVQELDQLVAFVVSDAAAPDASPERAWRSALAQKLPPYMVPSRFELLPEMPRLSSGKIDRKTLKALPLAALDAHADSDTPESPTETLLFTALGQLFAGQPIRREFDFFADLGGHSLLAAKLVSLLRNQAGLSQVTVRDIYQHRRIGTIALALEKSAKALPSKPVADWAPVSAWRRWRCAIAQAAMLPGLLTIRIGQWLAPFFTYHFFTGGPQDSIAYAVLMSVLVFLLATLLEFGIAIVGKWLIAGRLQAGRYPLWGWTYFRWWLADRMIEAAPSYLISGCSLHPWWLRALGARIGRDVQIGSITLRCPDLLTIDDQASIGNAVNFENARVEHGWLILGPIHIQAHAHVGSYCVLEGDTTLGAWAHLAGQSALSSGERVAAQRLHGGSPAVDQGPFDPASLPAPMSASRTRLALEQVFFALGALLVAALFFLPVFPTFMLIDRLDEPDLLPWLESSSIWLQMLSYFVLALPASGVMIFCTALLSAAIRWGILPKLKAGQWPVHSTVYCGKWLVNQIQESSLHVLHGIYATVYAPAWYRLLGAQVGRHAEISTALGVVPDMLTLGDDTFIADAVLLGDEEIDGGWMRMQPTVVHARSFVGNGAYIPDGTVLPENVLIGVLSSAPANHQIKSGDTWLGSPPLHLPARETVTGYSESLTFRPSLARRLGRAAIETLRIVIPHAIVISAGYSIVLTVMPAAGAGQWGLVAAELAIDGMLFGLATFVVVAALKWLLIGRYDQRASPMWTPFVWLSEAVTNIFEGITVPNFMRYLRGTPWLPLAFNLLGCRIGKGVYLDTTDFTEFDCVHIGDHAELNALTCPQTHLFEDRIMKIDHVRIGAKVNIGPRSTVLYSAQVQAGAQLGPMTLVMKGENIPGSSHWRGNPAQSLS